MIKSHAILLCAILVLTLASCGQPKAETTAPSVVTTIQTTARIAVQTTVEPTAGNSSTAAAEPRLGGVDSEGKTAVQIIEKYYELMAARDYEAMEKMHIEGRIEGLEYSLGGTTLLTFDYCKELANISDDLYWESHKDNNYYAISSVQTANRFFCNTENAHGSKGKTVNDYYVYYLAMETEDSQWEIVDCGYPPSKGFVESFTFGEFTTTEELLTRDGQY